MGEESTGRKDDRVLAALAHACIVLGLVITSLGGMVATFIIWITQEDKSSFAACQALQALVYQVATFLLRMTVWCCWFALWMVMLLPPLFANPARYGATPPAGLWIGLILTVIPLGFWFLTILYGLWGSVRCLGGYDFKYLIIGNWLASQE